MGVEITLLGPPAVRRDGQHVGFDTRKATALLAYLALAERPLARDALCTLLWPEHDTEHARGALRRTLSVMRTGVGAEHLRTEGDSVALDGVAVDVAEFRAAGEPASAAAVFRGPFLEGFGLRDCPDFDTWQLAEAVALERELGAVLKSYVETLAAAGDFPAALTQAERWLALDDLHEPAHRALIRLHALSGDRAAALDAYRACVRTLNEELGVAPVEATARLFTEISEGTLSAPDPGPVRMAPASPPQELPLVARDAELAALHELTPGRLVVVEGEAGIGKTRLVGQLRGERILAARCHEQESGLPYAPVAELLRQAAARPFEVAPQQRSDAALLTPELWRPGLPDAVTPDAPGAQARLLDAVAAVLAAAADVIVVDDVHGADEATVETLSYLARRLPGRALSLVLTWRAEAVPPGHPLRALVAGATVLRPRRLTETEVVELAGPDAWAESEGLPLFVAEFLAAGAVVGGSLLEARLAGVDAATRQVAGAAAVLGRGIDLDVLRTTSGRSEEEVVDALEALVARGILDAGYEFSHSKLRGLVYEDLGLARRRLLHRRAALALTRSDDAVVADHLREAGEDAAAAERFAAAAAHAAGLLANAEAAAHLEAALALGHPDPAALQERLGDARTLTGDYRAALAAYEAAAALAPSPEVEHKLGAVHLRRGEWGAAEARLRAALEGSDRPARVLVDLALVRHRAGDFDGAAELAAEAVRATADPVAGAAAHNLLGMLNRDPAELERSLALAEELGDRAAEVAALNNLALLCEDPEEAIALTERALAICADRHREAALLNNLADLHHAAGRTEAAQDHLRRAVAIFAEVGGDESARLPEIWKLVSW